MSGEEQFVIKNSGEEGVNQMRALLGLGNLVTNVNMPNRGQVSNLPLGAVVETNAAFTADSVRPIYSGNVPEKVYPLVARISGEQEMITTAGLTRNLDIAFQAFSNDPLVTCSLKDAKTLFDSMIENTKEYLKSFNI